MGEPQTNNQELAAPNRQHVQLSVYSYDLDEAKSALAPASPQIAVAELAACLTLVAPSGMSADDRAEWLKVARMTIGEVPESSLHVACIEARKTCRFASEIVPAVIAVAEEHESQLRQRIRAMQWDLEHPAPPPPPQIERQEPGPMTLEEYRSWTPKYREMARKHGWVSQDILDAAGADQ
jgi:hypothetical protein